MHFENLKYYVANKKTPINPTFNRLIKYSGATICFAIPVVILFIAPITGENVVKSVS